MTYNTSYSFTGNDVPKNRYTIPEEIYLEETPKPTKIAKIDLKKQKLKQTERDDRLNWFRNLREE